MPYTAQYITAGIYLFGDHDYGENLFTIRFLGEFPEDLESEFSEKAGELFLKMSKRYEQREKQE